MMVDGLNVQKKRAKAVRKITAHKHLPEVGVLQNAPEGVQVLLQEGNRQRGLCPADAE